MTKHDELRTRRNVLSQAAVGAALIASGAASAQPAPAAREKGPLVWLNMDQNELDDAYDQAVYAPNAAQLHKRRQAKCKEVRRASASPGAWPTADPGREARHLHDQAAERADQRVHPRRRVALRRGLGVLRRGRAVRACRRAFRRARLHRCDQSRRQPDADGRAGAPRGRLGPQERRELRRRSEPHLRLRPFLGRASGRHDPDHRLAEGLRRAGRYHQGRAAVARACTTSSRCGCPSAAPM